MKISFPIIIISTLLLSSCWSNNSAKLTEECLEPENPYSAWGHYEWFKWSKDHWGVSCNGRSNSFNEWCSEYVRQLDIYKSCN